LELAESVNASVEFGAERFHVDLLRGCAGLLQFSL
jgi:hypothetical protein